MCFLPNFSSCIIILQFRIIDLDNFRFYFEFLSLRIQKFLFNLFFDFFVNLDPNRLIFDYIDSSLSFLSKSIKILNFSPQFIVRFDQISKNTSKLS